MLLTRRNDVNRMYVAVEQELFLSLSKYKRQSNLQDIFFSLKTKFELCLKHFVVSLTIMSRTRYFVPFYYSVFFSENSLFIIKLLF